MRFHLVTLFCQWRTGLYIHKNIIIWRMYIHIEHIVLRTRLYNGRFFYLEMKEKSPDIKLMVRNCYIAREEKGTR